MIRSLHDIEIRYRNEWWWSPELSAEDNLGRAIRMAHRAETILQAVQRNRQARQELNKAFRIPAAMLNNRAARKERTSVMERNDGR